MLPPPAPKGVNPGLAPLTRLEVERRIDFAADVLLNFHRASEQKAMVMAQFGVKCRQAARWLERARARIVKASGRSKELHYANAIEFYESVIHNPLVHINARLKAHHQLDRLLGLGFRPSQTPAQDTTGLQGRVETVAADPLLAAVVHEARTWEPPHVEASEPPPEQVG